MVKNTLLFCFVMQNYIKFVRNQNFTFFYFIYKAKLLNIFWIYFRKGVFIVKRLKCLVDLMSIAIHCRSLFCVLC